MSRIHTCLVSSNDWVYGRADLGRRGGRGTSQHNSDIPDSNQPAAKPNSGNRVKSPRCSSTVQVTWKRNGLPAVAPGTCVTGEELWLSGVWSLVAREPMWGRGHNGPQDLFTGPQAPAACSRLRPPPVRGKPLFWRGPLGAFVPETQTGSDTGISSSNDTSRQKQRRDKCNHSSRTILSR